MYRRVFYWLALVLVAVGSRPLPLAQAAWLAKVEPGLWETAVSQPTTDFLLVLTTQADLSAATALPTKEAKGAWVFDQLTAVARDTQPAIIATLNAANVTYQPFWVVNMIRVTGNAALLGELAQRTDVARIHANPSTRLDVELDTAVTTLALPQQTAAIEWNISKINAPYAWSLGFTGAGIVIGGQDTGYDWDHEALKQQYRGWDANNQIADHNYNWHDAIHQNNPNTASGNPCGFDSPIPCDDGSHGTHTMGILVGDNGADRQIGVAPGARWIGCRNMEQGWGTPATYAECYQWFIAPTDINGANPNPALAPHVINNSWTCPALEGCTEPDILLTVVQNVRAAGIVTVHAAGNTGPTCASINTPPSIYDESFTVGNVGADDTIFPSSSRGPVWLDGSGRLKPDISAPGTNIFSAIPGDLYGLKTGTSMAAPHVAGLVALLLDAYPMLSGHVDTIEAMIQQTAVPLYPSALYDYCGGDTATSHPNHTFGYGRINALNLFNIFTEHIFLPVVTSSQTQ